MWWIIVVAVIAGLIALGILILSIPFDLIFRFEFHDKPKFDMRWAWCFGLVSRNVKPGRRKPKKPRPRRKFELRRIVERIHTAAEFMRIKGLINQFIRLITRTFRSLKIRELEVEFHVGLDDPSETFYLFAITEPVNRLLSHFQPYPISIQPSFVEPIFEGYARGSVRIYPVRLAPPLIRFVFSPPVFRLIGKMAKARWKRNR